MPDRSPELLELYAHGITAILASWLGLTVLLRAAARPAGRVFVLLAGLLVAWSLAIVVQRLTALPELLRPANQLEEVAASFLPAATLHISLALAVEGRRTRLQDGLLLAAYALGAIAALLAVAVPEAKLAITPPHLELPGVPGEVIGWAWIVVRGLMFALAIAWIVGALRGAGADADRRRQLLVMLATVLLGAIGGMIRMTPPLSDTDRWIGVSLITAAVLVATYAVFAQSLFFGREVATRAFRYSIAVGLAVTAYVVLLTAADQAVRELLGIDLPIVIVLGLVATMALFEPLSAIVRRRLAPDDDGPGYQRLLRALGESVLTAQRPDRAIEPALARLTRSYRLTGALAADADGGVIATHGEVPESPLALRLPLATDSATPGSVVFGPKRSGLPFTPDETELLGTAASFLGASLRLSAREERQAAALDDLSAERADVASRGTRLEQALVEGPTANARLQVFALGPLRVQRGDELVTAWGGKKAGSRQAEALFAFLFDRGERGIAKDEAVELIWPDTDLDRADLAFHRTMGGLRRTLRPQDGGDVSASAVAFHNDRYRLDPEIVAWSDVAAFEERLGAAAEATAPEAQLAALNEARGLYRGEYLDDCPFYGDSEHVEERRALLRERHVDLLVLLGERYEARGDRATAAAHYRHARTASGDDCPAADAGLARLAAAAAGAGADQAP